MPESNLSREMQRAHFLVATRGFKPLFPRIPLEVRRSLAETLSSDESIDHLCAVKRLHRPLADEVPLWDEYPQLAEWLDQMDIEEKEAEAIQAEYQEECNIRLQEAQKSFEEFLAGGKMCTEQLQETKITRRTLSKDDLQVGRTTHDGSDLRRRPSFMADTSHGHIEVEPLGTTCLKKINLPVTSTPHVPHRRGQPRVSAVSVALDLFSAETGVGPSQTRIDCVRDQTFELKTDEDGDANPRPQDTLVIAEKQEPVLQSEKTTVQKANATIVKSSPVDAKESQTSNRVPRIGSGRARPPAAAPPRILREPGHTLQGGHRIPPRIQVLPSKAACAPSAKALPARKPGLPSHEPSSLSKARSVPGSSSSSSASSTTHRTATGIARPSKPGRLPVRK